MLSNIKNSVSSVAAKTRQSGQSKTAALVARLQQYRRPLLVFCLGVMLLCALTLGLLPAEFSRQQKSLENHYRHELARLLQDQISVLLADQNLIAMQAVLGDLLEGESALAAVVYDAADLVVVSQTLPGIDATVLAEADSMTLPLNLNENYLGRIDISLKTTVASPAYSILLLLSLVASLAALLIWGLWLIARSDNKNPAARSGQFQQPDSGPGSLSSSDFSVAQGTTPAAVLSIELAGMESLFQQLSAEPRNRVMTDIDRAIKQILALYKGELIACQAGVISIAFFDQGGAEEVSAESSVQGGWFRGLCSGYLFAGMARTRQWLSPVNVVLSDDAGDIATGDHWMLWRNFIRAQKTPDDCRLVVKCSPANQAAISRFVQHRDESTAPFVSVPSLQPKYQRLLEKQLQQLLKHSG